MAGTLTLTEIADALNVQLVYLSAARPYLAGFPEPLEASGNCKRFNWDAVTAWAAGRDIAGEIKKAHAERRKQYSSKVHTPAPKSDKDKDAFNRAAARFLAGAYLPAQQRTEIQFKKLVARSTQPQTHTVRVRPAWYSEDA